MNRKTLLLGFFLIFISQTIFSQSDFKFPYREGYVNDFEGVFSSEQILELNSIVGQQEKETTNEIVIVSIKSFEPFETLFDYSLKLANNWGVGQKDKNNGITIVFGKQIRQIRIQVGYGLEKKLKDEEAKKIIDNVIIPEFKKGDYFVGIKNGLTEIIKEID
ncbi:MAG: TPM domain-containing protein [Sphingomonas sp.]|jgi:uncharacterized protein